MDRELEKEAFPAEAYSLADNDVPMAQLGLDGWAGCKSAEYREVDGKPWLVLEHEPWRAEKFNPTTLTAEIQSQLTGERLTIGEDDQGGMLEIADNWRQHGIADELHVRWRGETWLGRLPAVCDAADAAREKKRQVDASSPAGATSHEPEEPPPGADAVPEPPKVEHAEWKQVDAGLRKALLHLHTTTGHPSNEALARLLRQGRANDKAIKAAKHLWCSVCACLVKPTTARPAKLPVTPYEFN